MEETTSFFEILVVSRHTDGILHHLTLTLMLGTAMNVKPLCSPGTAWHASHSEALVCSTLSACRCGSTSRLSA